MDQKTPQSSLTAALWLYCQPVCITHLFNMVIISPIIPDDFDLSYGANDVESWKNLREMGDSFNVLVEQRRITHRLFSVTIQANSH